MWAFKRIRKLLCMYFLILSVDNLKAMGYYSGLKNLVEEMFVANNMTRVTLVAHSMGGPVSLYFLNNIVDQTWKDTYIHAYVPVAAAWDGAVAALEVILSGTADNNFLVDLLLSISYLRKRIINTVRSFQGVFWLLPSEQIFGNTALVQVGTRNYTANDFRDLFQLSNDRDGYAQYTSVTHLVDGWSAPNVSTFCYYGLEGPRSTPVFLKYTNKFPNDAPIKRVMGNGDGTVNQRVLEICHDWVNQSAPFEWRVFKASHIGIVSDDNLLKAIEQIVTIKERERETTEKSGNLLSRFFGRLFG